MSRPPDHAIAPSIGGLRGAAFWRALDDLVDAPDMRKRLDDAFPALASGTGDWRRRDILKCLGGALAIAGLDGCERAPAGDALPFVEQADGVEPGIARFYATAVELDGIARPMVGKTREGRPVKLEGNPDHPASRGATDAFMQADLLGLYDPDRSAAPLHRGQPATWAKVAQALADLRATLDASGGRGFRLLTGPIGSPTLRRQIAVMLERWPEARWHVQPGQLPALAGQEVLHLDRAHMLVCLDADPLGAGPLQLWNATRWGMRRRAFQAGEGAARLLVAEPSPTITGVAAERRLVASAHKVGPLLSALAAKVGAGSGEGVRLTSSERAWVERAAEGLLASRGQGLILIGPGQPQGLHDLAASIDGHLGNRGVTRSHLAVPDEPTSSSISALASDIAEGAVQTLFVLNANPAYSAPDIAPMLERVPLRLHAGLHVDETAQVAHWHLPMTHLLESWSDGRAADGSAVLIQPLVRPWLDARSRHAMIEMLVGGQSEDRALLRETWAEQLDGEDAWRSALISGIVPGSGPSFSDVTPPAARSSLPEPPDPSDLSLLIRPDPTVWDGCFAGNPWLQELPKPLTKLTWGNAIHISPALARERGLGNGDRARLSVADRSLTGPIWIMPGQERRTVVVHLGHGRRAGGHVAEGVGFDAYPLLGAEGAVRLDKTEGKETLSSTQQHFAMQDDEFVRFVDRLSDELPAAPPQSNFYPPQRSSPAWGMAIDLDLCIGCNACVVACVAENNVPMVGKEQVAMGREMHWLRVDRYYRGDAEEPEHAFQPVPCMHCENAPCEMGCPVNAAVHSPDGLNLQVYNRCIGTRTCSAYCPYKVRRFNWFDLTAKDPPELQAARNPEVTVRGRGVMEKCTYCIQRISAARITAKKEDRPIAEGEVVTACQAACPTQAIVFGDISDQQSGVSKRKASGRDYDLLSETNTRPRTTYQARIRRGDRG